MKALNVAILSLLMWVSISQLPSGSIQMSPVNSILNATTGYTLSYYAMYSLASTSTFSIDFSQSLITSANGTLTVSAAVNDATVSGATGSCLSQKCTIKLNQVTSPNVKIVIIFGNLLNPYFTANQQTIIRINYNGSYYQYNNYVIPTNVYTSMKIVLNSFSQSNYGVGNTNVTYFFNLSIPYTPANPSLSVTIPSEVNYGSISTALSFLNIVQNTPPSQYNSLLVFNTISVTPSVNTTGFLILTMSGMSNPQFIGLSSSFVVQFSETKNNGANCVGCLIANITLGICASSTTPGDAKIFQISSSTLSVGQITNLTLYSNLFAPIPFNGMFSIILPASMTPTLPVACQNIYGFQLSSSTPACSYYPTTTSINTTNFAYPILIGSGNAIIQVQVINAPDTRNCSIWLQTYDASGRLIGNSSSAYIYNAQPLSLSAQASRNASMVQTPFKLSINMTLGNALNASNIISVTLPPAAYNLSLIQCQAGGIVIACNKSINSVTLELKIALAPACSVCTIGSFLSFAVDNLINPSFINAYTQSIVVQTLTSFGSIEYASLSVELTPMALQLSNYNRDGSAYVGTLMSLSFKFVAPAYIVSNAGQIELDFPSGDAYLNVEGSNSAGWTYSQSAKVVDSNGNPLPNVVTYYSDTAPYSIQSIIITVCQEASAVIQCPTSLAITNLRRSIAPLSASSMTQTIKVNTLGGDNIAFNTFSTAQFIPMKLSLPLSVAASPSITYTPAAYTISFISPSVPFMSPISLSLSSSHSITGPCSVSNNSTQLGFSIGCALVNSTSISLSWSGDVTGMMVEYIKYTITISNVLNPISMIPLTYTVGTAFSGVNNMQSSATYAMQTPYTLALSYLKSNNTFGQATSLTIVFGSVVPTFSSISISLPSNLLSILPSATYQSSIANNSYLITGISALSSNTLVLNGVNPNSTKVSGMVTVSLLSGDYLSSQGTVNISPVDPMYLQVSAVSSNRLNGLPTNLSIIINRVNPYSSEVSYQIILSSAIFNAGNAILSSSSSSIPFVSPAILPISSNTSNSIALTISNMSNLQYLPLATAAFPNGLIINTLDGSNAVVSSFLLDGKYLVANTAVDGLAYVWNRYNTQINGVGMLDIVYSPRYPAIIASMLITMPASQSSIALSSSCMLAGTSNGNTNCLSFTINPVNNSMGTTATLLFSNQTKTTLTSVINLQPNTNALTVTMLTSRGQIVEVSSAPITPPIQYYALQVILNVSSYVVCSNNTVTISISNSVTIDVGSTIVLQLPSNTFTRIAGMTNMADCTYFIGSIKYNGCQYTYNGVYLSGVTVSYLGAAALPPSTLIVVTLSLSNSFAAYPFSNSTLTVYVANSIGYYLAQGSVVFKDAVGLSSWIPVNITGLTALQSSTTAGTPNTISISFNFQAYLPQNSTIVVLIPLSTYTLASTSQSNYSISSISSNSTHTLLSLGIPCSANATYLCRYPPSTFTFTVSLLNNINFKLSRDTFSIYIGYDSSLMSNVSPVQLAMYSPSLLTASISRSNSNAAASSNITITLTVSSPLPSCTFTISSLSNTQPLLSSVASTSLNSQSLPAASTLISSSNVSISLSSGSTAMTIVLSGVNPSLTPIALEQYSLSLADATYIYYAVSNVVPSKVLIPYGSGVSIIRDNPYVGATANLYLQGVLPTSSASLTATINNNNVISTTTVSLASNQFNASLGTTVNSNDASVVTSMSILMQTADSYAYNNSIIVSPPLAALNLSSLLSLLIPAMTISQPSNISINFVSTAVSSISVVVPPFFASLLGCCIDTSCSQTLISSCTSTALTSNSTRIDIKLTTQTSVTTVLIKVMSVSKQVVYGQVAVTVSTGLPTSSFTLQQYIAVYGNPITASLSLSNQQVNLINTYTIKITPISSLSYLTVQLEPYISSQSSMKVAMTINNANTAPAISNGTLSLNLISFASPSIVIVISNVTNPMDNRPLSFIVQQSNDSSMGSIYGYTNLTTHMTVLDDVSVLSAVRNDSKIGLPISLSMSIKVMNYESLMLISLPSSQVVYANNNCSMYAYPATAINTTVNTTTKLPCSYVGPNSVLTVALPMDNIYVLTGFTNQKYFSMASATDKVIVQVGYVYARAITNLSSTVFITPTLSVGVMGLKALTASSNVRLGLSTLSYSISLQNWQNVDGIVFTYDARYFLITTAITCTINSIATACYPYTAHTNTNTTSSSSSASSQSLLVVLPQSQRGASLSIVISSLINFIQPSPYSIVTVQASSSSPVAYSNIDEYDNDGSTLPAFTINRFPGRLITDGNYVQANAVAFLILFDESHVGVDYNMLMINMTTAGISCNSSSSLQYSNSITLYCSPHVSGTASFTSTIYHPSYPTITLATLSLSIYIYPALLPTCSDQNCDRCSAAPGGGEYCFYCREGMYSANGHCQNACPSSTFPYPPSNICEPCSPVCSSCYGLFQNQCLSCNDGLVLDSGVCDKLCLTGTLIDGKCMDGPECHSAGGCRKCSSTGFCYECLPNYSGAPTCSYIPLLPPLAMTYGMIPIAVAAFGLLLVSMVKRLPPGSILATAIFSFSFIQVFSWLLTIPILSISLAMVLLGFFLLRMVVSIVLYEVCYKRKMMDRKEGLLEEEDSKESSQKGNQAKLKKEEEEDANNTWKLKLVRVMSHFNGPDALELLTSTISQPILSIPVPLPLNIIYMLDRFIVFVLAVYMLSLGSTADQFYLPLCILVSGAFVCVFRLLQSQKIKACLNKIRS